MPIDLFNADLEGQSNDDRYAALAEFAATLPSEGWRHDYTASWDDDSGLTKVAAFANSFGGILIIGVRKSKTDPTCQLIGVASSAEYKTKIASSIAGNISPTPSYEIFECHPPNDPSLRFCIVRVRSTKALHLITKKGLQPVYIRNEDEARPANAAQLRALIERERVAPANAVHLVDRASVIRDALNLRCKYKDPSSDRWFLSASESVPTFLKLELIPSQPFQWPLDQSREEFFRRLVLRCFPRLAETQGGVATSTESRGADYYQYVWYHKSIDYEGRWHITEEGEIGMGTAMESSTLAGEWSIVDLALHVIAFAQMSLIWWRTNGYFGDGRVFAQLNVNHLQVAQTSAGGSFNHLVNLKYPRLRSATLPSQSVLLGTSIRTSANAEIAWDYFAATDSLPRLVALLMNQLLRGLGHSADWHSLEASLRELVLKCADPVDAAPRAF